VRMIDNHLGNGAIAASYATAKDAELLTGMVYYGSFTGDQATQRYFGPRGGGTGNMFVVGGEYNLSWGKLLRYPEEFWGEGADLVTSVFAQFASVGSNDPDFDKRKMYKFGAEVTYRMLPWIGLSGRADQVSPNSRDTEENFQVLSPKILLKTDWNSHELVTISYTRWLYGAHTHAQFPNDYTRHDLDSQMFALHFGMWW